MTTVNELIERLQEIADNGGGDKPVRLAIQPSYPLRLEIAGVAGVEDEERGRFVEAFKKVHRVAKNVGDDLVEFIEEIAEEFDVDCDLLIAAIEQDEIPKDNDGEVYVVAGSTPNDGNPYASKELWNQCSQS